MSSFLRKLDDPSIDEKKINSIDYFELVYLRHRYFRKSANPDPRRLAEFEEMICNISDNIYYRNVIIFKNVGFESDDLRNIGRVNTGSFVHMSGLKENPNLMRAFIEDDKSAIDAYKKAHSKEWLQILGSTDFDVVEENEMEENVKDIIEADAEE